MYILTHVVICFNFNHVSVSTLFWNNTKKKFKLLFSNASSEPLTFNNNLLLFQAATNKSLWFAKHYTPASPHQVNWSIKDKYKTHTLKNITSQEHHLMKFSQVKNWIFFSWLWSLSVIRFLSDCDSQRWHCRKNVNSYKGWN